MKTRNRLLAFALASAAVPALAGPPYITDDPAPTDLKHWEIYAFGTAEGEHSNTDSDIGLDLNYGAFEGVQLTATLPLSFSHERHGGWSGGAGDAELGVKYRFINDEKSGFSAAIFPRVILPTAAHSPEGKVRLLLPIWLQKDFAGGTSVFGGGGYMLNPGRGNRNVWQAAIAVTHDLTDAVSLGAEIAHQGSETAGGPVETRASVGSIVKLTESCALLLSGGPTWAGDLGYHAYAGLGFNF